MNSLLKVFFLALIKLKKLLSGNVIFDKHYVDLILSYSNLWNTILSY